MNGRGYDNRQYLKRALAGAAVLLFAAGCDTSCERALSTSIVYTGSRDGLVYGRKTLPGGQPGGGSVGPADRDDAGVFHGGSSSYGCWEHAATMDEPGGVIDGWVDVDGDDAARCGCDAGLEQCGIWSSALCGPEAGDPQGRKEYTLLAKGKTVVTLVFGDP